MSSSISLFGAGSWGTALAVHLSTAGREVTLWARRSEAVEKMRRTRHNPRYLDDLVIPSSVRITSDLAEAAQASDLWAVAVPSQNFRNAAEQLQPYTDELDTVVSLAKGIENESLMTMTEVLDEVFEGHPRDHISVLYGPSHAEEVAEGRPTTMVAAAPDETVAEQVQEAFMTTGLRVYVNTDVIGVEIGGSAKNVLAIAAGISDGVGYGDNAKAALITRGLAEIRRLGLAMGAEPETFAGLAGIGDLVVTCTSQHSRNRHVGEQVGQGKTLDELIDEMDMIAEGVRTTQSIYDLAQRHGLDLPITEAVYAVLFDGERPHDVVKRLMTRSPKRENWLPDALK